MKYIRTKDGRIIETSGMYRCDDGFGNKALHQTNPPFDDIDEEEIMKESDSIEELFDCFVDHDCGYGGRFLIMKDSTLRPTHEIYGAIWTDRGLIFAAKLNYFGRWELI